MPVSFAKTSFASGELAPSLRYRTDIAKYQTGAAKLLNCIVHPEGGTSNRPGLYYTVTAKNGNKLCRVIPFEFSLSQRYVIEAGDLYFRFIKDHGQILLTGNPYEIVSPYTESQLRSIYYAQSADTLFMTHQSVRPKMLQRFGDTDWRVSDYEFKDGPFMLDNTDVTKKITPSATTGAITLTASVVAWVTATQYSIDNYVTQGGNTYKCLVSHVSGTFATDLAAGKWVLATFVLFYAGHVGSLWKFRHYIQGQAVTQGFSGTGQSSSIKCGGTWRIITHGTWNGTLKVEKSTDGGTTWTTIRQFSSASDANVNTYGEDSNDGDPYLVRLNMSAYSSGTCNVDLTTDAYWHTGVAKITGYTSGTVVSAQVERQIGLAEATVDWAEGSWSDYRGWPACVVFDQDRLVFASTPYEPHTVWMTETGNYYSFRRKNPLTDSDGISVNLPSRQLNSVNGFVPLIDLIALTGNGEWNIFSSNDGPITPNTVKTSVNGYNGSIGVMPVVVGNRAIFVQASGSIIRDLGYELQSDGFTGANISVLSKHLFERKQIIEMAYQQQPDSLVWCVRNDGKALSMTYLREQDVVAWTPHETEGYFESVCSIQGDGYNEVYFVVRRGSKRFIERLVQRMESTEPEDQFFVDCGITYDGAPANVITGLGHLEGMEVAVLADGNVIHNADNPATVSSGQITLPASYSKVHVGLPYIADLESLNVDFTTNQGSIQGKKVKISKVALQLLNSRGGYLGPDFNTLYELKATFREYYDLALDLFTGSLSQILAGGFSEGARICLRQKDPLPITVLALVPDVTVGG